jgi:hypothetical protein
LNMDIKKSKSHPIFSHPEKQTLSHHIYRTCCLNVNPLSSLSQIPGRMLTLNPTMPSL